MPTAITLSGDDEDGGKRKAKVCSDQKLSPLWPERRIAKLHTRPTASVWRSSFQNRPTASHGSQDDSSSAGPPRNSSEAVKRAHTPLLHIFRPDMVVTGNQAPAYVAASQTVAHSSAKSGLSAKESWPTPSNENAAQLPSKTIPLIDLTGESSDGETRMLSRQPNRAPAIHPKNQFAQSQTTNVTPVKDNSDLPPKGTPSRKQFKKSNQPLWAGPTEAADVTTLPSADITKAGAALEPNPTIQRYGELSPGDANRLLQFGSSSSFLKSGSTPIANRHKFPSEPAAIQWLQGPGFRDGMPFEERDEMRRPPEDQRHRSSSAMKSPKRAAKIRNMTQDVLTYPRIEARAAKHNELLEHIRGAQSDSDDAMSRMRRSISQASAMYSSGAGRNAQVRKKPLHSEANQSEPKKKMKRGTGFGKRPSVNPSTNDQMPDGERELQRKKDDASLAPRIEPIPISDNRSRSGTPETLLPDLQSKRARTAAKDVTMRTEPKLHTDHQKSAKEEDIIIGRLTKVSADVKALKAILRPLIERTDCDQEYLMEGLLSRAQSEAAQFRGADPDQSLPDPFAGGANVPTGQIAQSNPIRAVCMESWAATSRKKFSLIESQAIAFKSKVPRLPRYNSIARLGSNILARNDRDLRYLPYFPQEEWDGEDELNSERREELLEGFDNRVKWLPEARKCSELADFWRESTEHLLEEVGCTLVDVMYYLLHGENAGWNPQRHLSQRALSQLEKKETSCVACETRFRSSKWTRQPEALSKERPDDETLAVAGLVCSVFTKVMKFSIWHIASTDPAVQGLLLKSNATPGALGSQRSRTQSLCVLCHVFDCPNHGSYLEDETGNDDDGESDLHQHVTDRDSNSNSSLGSESNYNIRQNVAFPENPVAEQPRHKCGIFCVNPRTLCAEILALHGDGGVKGKFNIYSKQEHGDPGYSDAETCSDSCFWDAATRSNATVADIVQAQPLTRCVNWTEKKVEIYRSALGVCLTIRRGPCIMASLLAIPCCEVFREMLIDIHMVAHPATDAQQGKVQLHIGGSTGGNREKSYGCEVTVTNKHHKRSPFIPCSHLGPCHRNTACGCWRSKIACEWTCGCEGSCPRRFQGCKCAARGSKVCFKDPSCDCFAMDRECDPWLCGSCGVLEILDPVNRSSDRILNGRCRNAMVQRGIPKRTLKGPSEVHGWGLFAGGDISSDEFVGEYKGEIISEAESNRRGLVYHYRGLEYLFRLNKDQEIDASRAGNKMRFINNSERPSTINVYAKTMFCNGVQRIGLFAGRNLMAGEEMFFRYGYPESVTKHFWEKEDLEDSLDHDSEPEKTQRKRTMRGVQTSSSASSKAQSRRAIGKQVKGILANDSAKEKQRHVSFLEDIADTESDVSAPQQHQQSVHAQRESKRKRRSSRPLIDNGILEFPHKSGTSNLDSRSSLRANSRLADPHIEAQAGDEDEAEANRQEREESRKDAEKEDRAAVSPSQEPDTTNDGFSKPNSHPFQTRPQASKSRTPRLPPDPRTSIPNATTTATTSESSNQRNDGNNNNSADDSDNDDVTYTGKAVRRSGHHTNNHSGVKLGRRSTTSRTRASATSTTYTGRKRGRPFGWKKGVDFK